MTRLLLIIVLGLGILMACGGEPQSSPGNDPQIFAVAEPDSEDSGRCGDRERLTPQLQILFKSERIDQDVLIAFEDECGVEVAVTPYAQDEELITSWNAVRDGLDVVMIPDYLVAILSRQGRIRPLSFENIPNTVEISTRFQNLPYVANNAIALPFQWGTTGIAYNTSFVAEAPTSWAALFDLEQVCSFEVRAAMLDEERAAVGAALAYLGYAYNDVDREHHAAAGRLLQEQRPCLVGYLSPGPDLSAGELRLAQATSVDALLARDENENVRYVIPEEGGSVWLDYLAISADSDEAYTAEILINFMLDPEIAAQNADYSYAYPTSEAADALRDEYYLTLMADGGLIVDEEIWSRLSWIERDTSTSIFSDTFLSVRGRE